MSKIHIKLEENVVVIQKISSRNQENNTEKVPIEMLINSNKEFKCKLKATNKEDRNQLMLLHKIDNYSIVEDSDDEEVEQIKERAQPVIMVYSKGEEIRVVYCSIQKAYKKLIKLNSEILKLSINKRRVIIKLRAYIINKYKIKINEKKFYIDKKLGKDCELKEYNKKILNKKDSNIYYYQFDLEDILRDTSTINGQVRFTLNIEGIEINYNINMQEEIKNTRYYYLPIKKVYTEEYAIHFRRTRKGDLVLVKRKKEPIENTLKFKIFESKIVSLLFLAERKINSKIRKNKINLFYEKFSSKAEEGTYDLFLLFQKYKKTKDYFIIDENSADYAKIKDNPGVVKKYSLKYYWLIYNAKNCISTELPLHLNILRSNNKYIRKALIDKKFIFLQHGVTYLKYHGRNSPFIKGREGESDYIIVGSEKEKDVVVDMLDIKEEQVIKTGLPIFSKIQYNHINQESDNYITIMLTWKPYEEHLYDFKESRTYQNMIEVCEMLKKYIDLDKVIIISHPKAYELIKNTDLKNSLWDKPISKALEKTKLLITDYSSVCYNAFYQGAGVIFYQPDLEKFERDNGKLIPNEDEYIGERAFNIEQLEEIIKNTIKEKEINLETIRKKEYEERYKEINEFYDGKNIERIYDELMKLKII